MQTEGHFYKDTGQLLGTKPQALKKQFNSYESHRPEEIYAKTDKKQTTSIHTQKKGPEWVVVENNFGVL